jgi:Papain-like cysteine protease AvrRpt2
LRGGIALKTLLPLLLIAGCATDPTPDLDTFAQRSGSNSFEVFDRKLEAPQALVLPVVHDRQTKGPACGAHALASVVNYWRGPGTVTGEAIFGAKPPTAEAGYSMAELIVIASEHGLLASAVRLPPEAVVRELEAGRPVLTPVRLPSIYVQQLSLPGGNAPVIGIARNSLIYRAGRVSEFTRLALVDHYLLVVGHDEDSFVVVEPVMGYRTISRTKLARYRRAFGDAAIVFSSTSPPQR